MIILLGLFIFFVILLFSPIKIYIHSSPFDIQISYLGIQYAHNKKQLKLFLFSLRLNTQKKEQKKKTNQNEINKKQESSFNFSFNKIVQYYKNYQALEKKLQYKIKKKLSRFFTFLFKAVKIKQLTFSAGFDNLMLQGIYSGLFIPINNDRLIFKSNFLQKKYLETHIYLSLFFLFLGFFSMLTFPWLSIYKKMIKR